MPNVKRPYKALSILPALYIIIASAICIALCTLKQVRAAGVGDMHWVPVYYLTKAKVVFFNYEL
jgi:hypothetical protein